MADTPEGRTPGTVPSKPGIMSVSSTVLHPDVLDPHDFCNWYENTHIQQVHATGGISRTARYESLSFHDKYQEQNSTSGVPVPENQNFKYDFLTLYEMPDLAFRETEAFRRLDGQSKPSDESDLLEKVFKQSEFCTRFCEEIEIEGPKAVNSTAPFIVTIGMKSSQWSAGSIPTVAKLAGSKRMRKYKLREASVLSEFHRSYVGEPREFTVSDFDSRPDASSVLMQLHDAKDLEIGFWTLRRDYDGTERMPAPWKPKGNK